MKMLTTLFYLSVIFFITWEVAAFRYAAKLHEIMGRKIDEMEEERKIKHLGFALVLLLIMVCYWIVNVIGILKSHQRLWFAIVFAMALLKLAISKPLKNHPKAKVIYQKIDSIITIVILAYIIYLQYFK